MTHIPNSNTPGFRRYVSDDTQRMYFAPHSFHDFNTGMFRSVHPACGVLLGSTMTEAGVEVPTIRLDHGMGPLSLLYATTPDEMRVLAQGLIDEAERYEKAAADLMSQTLAKRGGNEA